MFRNALIGCIGLLVATAASAQDISNPLAYGGIIQFPPGATFGTSPTPGSAPLRLVGLNDIYHDNLLDLQNASVSGGGSCGNSALRLLDSNGIERGAMGLSPPTSSQFSASPCSNAFDAGMIEYFELSQIQGANDANTNGSFRFQFTNDASAPYFAGAVWDPLIINGNTNLTDFYDHTNRTAFQLNPETEHLTMYGLDAKGNLDLFAANKGAFDQILAANSDGTAQGILLGDALGGGIINFSYGNYATLTVNPANAVNYLQFSGSATGQPVQIAAEGSDGNSSINLVPQTGGTIEANGNAGVNCNSGLSATTGRVIDGIVTHC